MATSVARVCDRLPRLPGGPGALEAGSRAGTLVLLIGEEGLLSAELDLKRVYEERQNFDPSGHYARPDVLSLRVNRQRQGVADWA